MMKELLALEKDILALKEAEENALVSFYTLHKQNFRGLYRNSSHNICTTPKLWNKVSHAYSNSSNKQDIYLF